MTQPQRAASATSAKTLEPSDDLLTRVIEETERIEKTAAACAIDATIDGAALAIAARRSFGIQALKRMMHDDFVDVVLVPLMNSRLGFLTDRDPAKSKKEKEPYDRETIRVCAIEALLNGARFTGNEWNIIAGNCYLTQAFYKRKLSEVPGVTDIVYSPGFPDMGYRPGLALCRYQITWKQNGVPRCLRAGDGRDVAFPFKIDQYTTPDAIIGKATRDAAKLAYETAIGSIATPGDPPVDVEPEHAEPRPENDARITPAEVAELAAKCRFARLDGPALATALNAVAGVQNLEALTPPGALAFHRWIDQQVAGK